MIRDGFDPEVDRLRSILHGGKSFLAQMEAEEKEKTGIRTLKIGYNKVFGYYIEVSNSFKEQVPDTISASRRWSTASATSPRS